MKSPGFSWSLACWRRKRCCRLVDAVASWLDQRIQTTEINAEQALTRVSQTSLREMVGSSLLSTLLSDRKQGCALLCQEIRRKIAEWGVAVASVEIRDIGVPPALQDP